MSNKYEAIANRKDGMIFQIEVRHNKSNKAYEIVARHCALTFHKDLPGRSTCVSIFKTFHKIISLPASRASKKAEANVIDKMNELKNVIFAESCRFAGYEEVQPEWVSYVSADLLPEAIKA